MNPIVYIVIYVALWFVFYRNYQKKRLAFGAGSVLVLSYLIYSLFSLVLYVFTIKLGTNRWDDITLFPFIYLFLMLIIATYPVLKFKEENIEQIVGPPMFIFYFIAVVCFVGSIIEFFDSLPTMREGLIQILYFDGGEDAYRNMKESYLEMTANDHSVFLKLFIFPFNYLREFPILIFCYYLTFKNHNKYISLALLFPVVETALRSISIGSRTGALLPLFTIVVVYISFMNLYDEKVKKIFKIILAVAAVIVLVPVIYVTVSRFDYREGGTLLGIADYAGQCNLNFNDMCLDAGGKRYGDRTLGGFKKMLDFDVPVDSQELRLKYSGLAINDGVFSTFIGDFVLDFGPIATVFILVLFSFLFTRLTQCNNRQIRFDQLLVLYFVMVVCSQGGMYLFSLSFGRNQRILGMLIIYIILRFFSVESDENAKKIIS